MGKWLLEILSLFCLVAFLFFIGPGDEKEETDSVKSSEIQKNERVEPDIFEKGYNLPVEEEHRNVAEEDCKAVLEQIHGIYMNAEKGQAMNVVLSEETALQMAEVLKETGNPVTIGVLRTNMYNYEKMDGFLMDSLDGTTGDIVLYDILLSGGVSRMEFHFDGTDMYVLESAAAWNKQNEPVVTYTTYTRIKEWEYTENGWFSLEYCVPEPPEVTEVVLSEELFRVRPQKEEYRKLAEKYLYPVGYQGNNLLCSNWDSGHMEEIDYNGLYQYLYSMKYEDEFGLAEGETGIEKKEFENLLMEYLPITEEQLRQYAVYDEESQVYLWAGLGCGTYTPNFFGKSIPEITDIKENQDGSYTLTVDAVCEMLGMDAVMSHQLTVQFLENGGIRYLGNQILGDGMEKIPEYQYRLEER